MLPAVLMIGLSPTLDSVLIASVYGGLSAWVMTIFNTEHQLKEK